MEKLYSPEKLVSFDSYLFDKDSVFYLDLVLAHLTKRKKSNEQTSRFHKAWVIATSILLVFLAKTGYTQDHQNNNSAIQLNSNSFRLTPDLANTRGEIWRKTPVSLHNSFEISFKIFLGSKDANGADGIAFAFQRQAGDPLTAAGRTGEGLGIGHGQTAADGTRTGGVTPSVAIEFDTHRNLEAGGTAVEPASDHIAIFKNGEEREPVAEPVQMSHTSANTEDNALHSVTIKWLRVTKTFYVYFDGNFRTSYSEDYINTVFGGDPIVYFGFTASTGDYSNIHEVHGISYTETSNVPPVASNITNAPVGSIATNVNLTDLSASDADGTIAKYTILSLPTAGTLHLNRANITVGQVLTPAEATMLAYDAPLSVSSTPTFTYSATDNEGLPSAPATFNIPVGMAAVTPSSTAIFAPPISNQATQTSIPPLSATGGTITGYTVTPANFNEGELYYATSSTGTKTLISTAGTNINVSGGGTAYLWFDPKPSYTGTSSFTYTATNSQGNTSSPATYSIPVYSPPLASNVTSFIMNTGKAAPTNPFTGTDADGRIASFKVTELPSSGTLYLNGTSVAAGTEYQATDNSLAGLTYLPNTQSPASVSFPYSAIDNEGHQSNAATYTIQVDNTPLPVELTRFSGSIELGVVRLAWSTTSEKDNDYFQVERSLNGKTFTAVGQVKGAGYSSIELAYTFQDASAPKGTVYYLLKQVDFEGEMEYSKVIALKAGGKVIAEPSLGVYPNPTNGMITLSPAALQGAATITLFQSNGRKMNQWQTQFEAGRPFMLDFSSQTSGMYFLEVQTASSKTTIRVVKM
ncbi:lectin-like domain-containing protein [Rufibacter tibetensis]|uniref:lectin-like domain-containing protein n=1 Tax=Rufibacter tibetensis TaxID=512763 RepID=UPI0007804973|nr:T9SS type A sorting domain-containing protein [Rufibacter tibetensis]